MICVFRSRPGRRDWGRRKEQQRRVENKYHFVDTKVRTHLHLSRYITHVDITPNPNFSFAEPVTIDEFFLKTTTKPVLYYLPLTDEQVEQRKVQQARQASRDANTRRQVQRS